MDLTRRQFALSLAATTAFRASLFAQPLSSLGVPRGIVPGRVTWAHDPAAVTWDGTGSWWTDANNNQAAIDSERTHPCAIWASQRRCAGGRSHDQLRANTNVLWPLVVRDLGDKEFCRFRTHLMERLANGR
jgi:hypothetical protein